MRRADSAMRSTQPSSAKGPKPSSTGIEHIGSAAFTRCSGKSHKQLPGSGEPSNSETTTIHGLRGTRTTTSFVAVLSMNGFSPTFEAAPINTDENLELLPSETAFIFEIVPRLDRKIPNPMRQVRS